MKDISIIQNNCQLQITERNEKVRDSVSFGEIKNKIAAETKQLEVTLKYTKKTDSLEEYRNHIYSLILDYSNNTSKEGEIFVDISEECLLAMKNDKNYESWVLKTIQKAFVSSSYSGYETFTFLKFGAAKNDFSQQSYSFPDRKTRERLRKLIQEQREAMKKKRKKLLEKKLLEEKWRKQAYQTAYAQLKILDRRIQAQEENRNYLNGKQYYKADHSSSIHAAAKRKANAYKSSFLFIK